MTSWRDWRKCPVCGAVTGQACRSQSGTVAGGRPDGMSTELDRPHMMRKQRVRR